VAGSARAQVPLVQLSTDTFTNSDSQHATEIEPDTFAFGHTIVAAFQVGRAITGGASDTGFATSTDRGRTWTSGFLPGISKSENPSNPYDRANDPAVGYDAKHGFWMIVTMPWSHPAPGPRPPANIPAAVVSRSADGIHWDNPIAATPDMTSSDKPWIACDNTPTSPFYGNCYVEWDVPDSGGLIQMSTSSDGGLTWSAPVSSADNATGIGGLPLPQPNGNVIVPFLSKHIGQKMGDYPSIAAFRSTDGGASWSSAVTIATRFVHLEAGGMRTIPEPSAEVNKHGRVYVAWQDCRFRVGCYANDIVMSSSQDGVTWKKVSRIPIDSLLSGVDHFLPGLAVNPRTFGAGTHLALTYYYYTDTRCIASTCQLNVGFVASNDGGTTWSPALLIAGPMKLSWLPRIRNRPMLSDYLSTSYSGDKAFSVFMVAQPKEGKTFNTAMFTTADGLSAARHGPVFSSAREKPVPNPTSEEDVMEEVEEWDSLGQNLDLFPLWLDGVVRAW
jgi:hypothetical protein